MIKRLLDDLILTQSCFFELIRKQSHTVPIISKQTVFLELLEFVLGKDLGLFYLVLAKLDIVRIHRQVLLRDIVLLLRKLLLRDFGLCRTLGA
jgi:hypothetical protein